MTESRQERRDARRAADEQAREQAVRLRLGRAAQERVAEREKNRRGAGAWIDSVTALIAIGAGVYLLSGQSTTGESTWFSLIAHGMGAYFIAKGIFIGRTLHLQARMVELLAGSGDRDDE